MGHESFLFREFSDLSEQQCEPGQAFRFGRVVIREGFDF
jgi:hypothetical protein